MKIFCKKGLSFLLVVLMSVSVLVSCGEKSPDHETTPETTPGVETTPEPGPQSSAGVIISVETDGDDTADGVTKPVATLTRALEIAKAYIRVGNVSIVMGDGDFYVTDPIEVTEKMTDGEHGHKLTIAGNGKTVINGGYPVTGWQKSADEHIYEAKVDLDNVYGFCVNGENMTLASQKIEGEYKNGTKPGIIMDNNEQYSSWHDYESFAGLLEVYFTVKSKGLPAVEELQKEIDDLFMYNDQTFHRNRFEFQSVTEDGTKYIFRFDEDSVALCDGHAMANYNSSQERYQLVNSYLFLDSEGEYYFDKNTKTLYYYSETTDPANAECVIPVSDSLMNIKGSKDKLTADITLYNLIFKYGACSYFYDRPMRQAQGNSFRYLYLPGEKKEGVNVLLAPGMLNISYTSNITIDHCEFRNSECGGIAAGRNVYQMAVTNCIVYDMAGNGISCGILDMESGWGVGIDGDLPDDLTKVYSVDRTISAVPMGLTVTNNRVENIGMIWSGSTAVEVLTAGDVVVEHNTITNVADTGINGGNGLGNYTYNKNKATPHMRNFSIRYNDIARVGLMNEDCGAIYTQSYFCGDGCLVSDNYIDLDGKINGVVSALYTDGGSENVTMTHNAVKNTQRWLWCRVLPCVSRGSGYKWAGTVDGSSIINCTITGNYVDTKNHTSGWDDASTAEGGNVIIDDNQILEDFDNDPNVIAIREAAGAKGEIGAIVGGLPEELTHGNTGKLPETLPPEDIEPEGDVYIWEISAEWRNVDLRDTLTAVYPGLPEWDAKYQNQEIQLVPDRTTHIAYAEIKVPDPSVNLVNNSLENCQWILNDQYEEFDHVLFDVISAPDPDDPDKPGELSISFMKNYTWDIVVERADGCDGEVTLINPGSSDWPEIYKNQTIELTADCDRYEFKMFNCSDWIVDNSAKWYQWVIDKHGNRYKVDIRLDHSPVPGDYEEHGLVIVSISKGK